METQVIRDFYGKVIGTIERDNQGNEIAKDFYGRMLGRYDKAANVTRDFYGRQVARGNVVVSFIFNKR